MKLAVLEYFVTVAEVGTISGAAQKLYIAQPSLTKALKTMEKELGVELFIRTNTGIRLTEAGSIILPQAKQMLSMYNDWKKLGKDSKLDKINIYAHISLAGFMVPDVILSFREEYPELAVNYITDASPESYVSGEADEPSIILSIGQPDKAPSETGSNIQNKILAKGYYGCLVQHDNVLAKKSFVTFEDLKSQYLVLPNGVLESLHAESPHISAIDSFLPELVDAITPKHIVNVDTVGSVVELVLRHKDTFAVSFAPVHYRYRAVRSGEVTNVPLNIDGVEAELRMIYSKQAYKKHPAFRTLVSALENAITDFLNLYRES